MTRWILVAIIGLLALGCADAITRQFMRGTARADVLGRNPSAKRLAVLYGGLMADPITQFAPIIDWYKRNGHEVICVRAIGDVYDLGAVVTAATEAIKDISQKRSYEHIVFDGASLGAIPAVKTLQRLREQGFAMPHTSLLLEGSPASWRDVLGVQKYGAWLIGRLRFGWLANRIPAVRWMFVPPKEENIEPTANRKWLERSVEVARRTSLSRYSSETAVYAKGIDGTPGSLKGLADKVIFVWFDRDHDTVDQQSALQAWAVLFGVTPRVVYADAAHVGFLEAPVASQIAHECALG